MPNKGPNQGWSALFFLFGVLAFVLHLIGNDGHFTGNNFLLCVIFAYCVYLHFRVAHLEKGTDQETDLVRIGGHVKKPTNLRFEGETVHGMPDGWSDSHGNVDNVSTLYSFDVESREEGAGEQCVRMHRVNASKEEFGSLMQTIPAHTLAGRAIRIEADIRTEDLDEMAGLWLRIDGDESMLFFDNMEDRPIQGTTPWKTYSQETEVPTKAKWLNYGFLLAGNGTLWAADVRVSVSDEQGQYRPV